MMDCLPCAGAPEDSVGRGGRGRAALAEQAVEAEALGGVEVAEVLATEKAAEA